ncbi:MAG: glycerophosphodiester phosphodiesterase [Promethearchaeota archaeon]
MSSEFLYIGHRGTRTDFDENTIKAFKKAIEFGSNCVEFDVRKTKDGKLIIMHDSTLDRTTTGSGELKNINYGNIAEFKTINHYEIIPLLSEVFDSLKSKTQFMIELKDNNIKDRVLEIVKNYNLLEHCIFSGRNLQELGQIKEVYPSSEICYNITKGLGFGIKEFLKFGKLKKLEIKPDLISLRSNYISREFIEICHKNSIKSLAWDFLSYTNPIFHIKSFINMGIDGILFDNHKNIAKIKRWYDSI